MERFPIVAVTLVCFVLCAAARAQTLGTEPAWDRPTTFYGQLGSTLATADLNGDGYDDLAMGGPFYFTPCCPSVNQQGLLLVYNGGPGGPSTTISWFEVGAFSGTTLGDRVASAGDVNGDGFDDLVFNSGSGFGNGTHALHVRFGSLTGPGATWDYDTGMEFGALGPSVAGGGDIDGDGFDDVIAGFPLQDGSDGKLLVFEGSMTGLPAVPDQELSGAGDSRFGEQVAFAGDVDGDGFDDVLVCENPLSGSDVVHLYPGSSTGLESSSAWSYRAPGIICQLEGQLRGVGDVNRDGYDDIAVASPFEGHDEGEGLVRIFLGSAAGLASDPEVTLFGDEQFGSSVAPAGDVNVDGFADIVVGAYGAPPGDTRGSTFVYFGTRDGVTPDPAWTGVPPLDTRDVGWSVAGGDLNGDGFADVVSGDPNSPAYYYGRALVYLNTAQLVPGPASAVPETGVDALRLDRNLDGDVELSWGASCNSGSEDFIVYGGTLGDFTGHIPAGPCGIGGGTTWSEPAAGGSRYFLVVPRSLDAEGSYGQDGDGLERPASIEACFPRHFAVCD